MKSLSTALLIYIMLLPFNTAYGQQRDRHTRGFTRTSPKSSSDNLRPTSPQPPTLLDALGTNPQLDLLNQQQGSQVKDLQWQQQIKTLREQIRSLQDKEKKDSGDQRKPFGGSTKSKEEKELLLKDSQKKIATLLTQLPSENNSPEISSIKALLSLASNQRVKAHHHLKRIPKDKRSAIDKSLLFAIYKLYDMPELAKGIWPSINDVEIKKDLRLNSLAICRSIEGFGQYTTFDDYTFGAGQKILVYSELDNFKSVPLDKGISVRLNISIKIETDSGILIWETPSHWRGNLNYQSKIRDLFLCVPIAIPRQIHPNNIYTIHITVTDETRKQKATNSIKFRSR